MSRLALPYTEDARSEAHTVTVNLSYYNYVILVYYGICTNDLRRTLIDLRYVPRGTAQQQLPYSSYCLICLIFIGSRRTNHGG